MPPRILYLLTRRGRFHYLFWALLSGALAMWLSSALFGEKARSQNHAWLVYVFAGCVIALWLGFSVYCFIRAFTSRVRVIVDAEGLFYNGIFRPHQFPWAEVTSIRTLYERGGFEWIQVTATQAGKRRQTKLDFSGLDPDRRKFMKELPLVAPWVQVK
jgi:hypothetical protein